MSDEKLKIYVTREQPSMLNADGTPKRDDNGNLIPDTSRDPWETVYIRGFCTIFQGKGNSPVKGDGQFKLSPAKAAMLIRAGVAEIAQGETVTAEDRDLLFGDTPIKVYAGKPQQKPTQNGIVSQ